jgi:hypothetical protein
MDQVVQHKIRSMRMTALHAVYHRCVQENRLLARPVICSMVCKFVFPSDRQVKQLYIALCLQQNHLDEAMRAIQSLVACCTPDNGLIDAALAVRAKCC